MSKPNTSYLETYFEVVQFITNKENSLEDNIVKRTAFEGGTGALWELAEDWADEFEEIHKDNLWEEEMDFFETIEEFLCSKLTPPKKYPFEEGDDYWTIEDNKVVWSCWDEISEDLYNMNPNQVYYKTEAEAIQNLK